MRPGPLGARLAAVWRAGARRAGLIAVAVVFVVAVMVTGARRGRW